MSFRVLIFAEGSFERSFEFESNDAAHIFCMGVACGAGLYGGINVGAYVLPEEDEDMQEEQDDEEIERALSSTPSEEPSW